MLCTKKLGLSSIDSNIYRIFEEISTKNPTYNSESSLDFHHLKTMDEQIVKSPYSLYMCSKETEQKESTGFFNRLLHMFDFSSLSYSNVAETREKQRILYPKVKTRVGPCYLFSLEPLKTRPSGGIARFAVFSDQTNTNYIDKPQDEAATEMTTLMEKPEAKPFTCFVYVENGVQYWALKNREFFTEYH